MKLAGFGNCSPIVYLFVYQLCMRFSEIILIASVPLQKRRKHNYEEIKKN